MAVVGWDGDGGDTDFDTAGNWDGGAAPVVAYNADSLTFAVDGGGDYQVDVDTALTKAGDATWARLREKK